MTRSFSSSYKWYIALLAGLVLCASTQVAATSERDAIPIFRPNSAAAAGVGGSNGVRATIDPLEYSPDSKTDPVVFTAPPTSKSVATPMPTPVPVVTVSTPSPAANTTTVTPTPTTTTPSVAPVCPSGYVQMSVENVPGVFCVHGPKICSGGLRDGDCPGVQSGLLEGSHCGVVYTGVYGCRPGPAPRQA